MAELNHEEMFELYQKHINPGLARLFRFMGADHLEWRAEGSLVYDIEGNEYIDCASGYAVLNLGHRHPNILAAVQEQMSRMTASTRLMINPVSAQLGKLLAEVTPGNLESVFLSNSGTESVEAAMKIARIVTGRPKIISTSGAFHGKTLGALAATANPDFRKPFLELLTGVEHVPYGDAQAVAQRLDDRTAAVIVEPVQGEAGAIVPPDGYLRALIELCHENGSLLIVDEVQTGMGRTGRFLACEHEGVVPDILTMAKGLGGGVMPIGATITTREIFATVFDQNPIIHSSTMGGNPLAAAAALAAIRTTIDEDLPRQAEEKGSYLMEHLNELQRRYPEVIKEVRGKGLLIALEMQKQGAGGMFLAGVLQRGVLVVPSLNNLAICRILPALNIPMQLLEKAVDAITSSVEEIAPVVDQL